MTTKELNSEELEAFSNEESKLKDLSFGSGIRSFNEYNWSPCYADIQGRCRLNLCGRHFLLEQFAGMSHEEAEAKVLKAAKGTDQLYKDFLYGPSGLAGWIEKTPEEHQRQYDAIHAKAFPAVKRIAICDSTAHAEQYLQECCLACELTFCASNSKAIAALASMEELAYRAAGYLAALYVCDPRIEPNPHNISVSLYPGSSGQYDTHGKGYPYAGVHESSGSRLIYFEGEERDNLRKEALVVSLAAQTAYYKFKGEPVLRVERPRTTDSTLEGMMTWMRAKDITECYDRAAALVDEQWVLITSLANLLLEKKHIRGLDIAAYRWRFLHPEAHKLTLRRNYVSTKDPCALCLRHCDSFGLDYFLGDTNHQVCEKCAEINAPYLVSRRDAAMKQGDYEANELLSNKWPNVLRFWKTLEQFQVVGYGL